MFRPAISNLILISWYSKLSERKRVGIVRIVIERMSCWWRWRKGVQCSSSSSVYSQSSSFKLKISFLCFSCMHLMILQPHSKFTLIPYTHFFLHDFHIIIHMYMCTCVCVCVVITKWIDSFSLFILQVYGSVSNSRSPLHFD